MKKAIKGREEEFAEFTAPMREENIVEEAKVVMADAGLEPRRTNEALDDLQRFTLDDPLRWLAFAYKTRFGAIARLKPVAFEWAFRAFSKYLRRHTAEREAISRRPRAELRGAVPRPPMVQHGTRP